MAQATLSCRFTAIHLEAGPSKQSSGLFARSWLAHRRANSSARCAPRSMDAFMVASSIASFLIKNKFQKPLDKSDIRDIISKFVENTN